MDTLITRIFPANAITIEGIWENLFFEPASNNIIQQNHIVSSTSHHGINVMNTYLTTPPPNKDTLLNYGNIIRDNFIDRCQAGIYIRKQKDFQIFNNIICRSYSTKPNSDDIDESDEGHAIKLAYDGTADSYSFMANGKIYNNLFYNYLNCGIYSEYAKQIYIYNNIFVKNMTLGNSSNGDEFIRVNSPEASEIKYNFYFKNHNGYPLSDTSFKWYNGLLVKGYRSWSINYEPTSISPGNPFFVDSAKNDFHYTCWSRLLINRGNNVNNSLVNKDMEGRTRLNSTWDLGPYEWNGTWCDSPNEISFNDTSLILSFAEPLDESLMLNTENYETHESININEVKLLNDKKILILTNKHKKPSKYYLRVKNLKFANKENIYNDLTFLYEYDSTLSKETSAKEYLPDFELDQNYPNPFNPDTEIKFSLNGDGIVCLKVYNILGKEITTLVNEHKSQGNYTINFDGKDLTSGFYIYTLQYKNQLISKKMLLLK